MGLFDTQRRPVVRVRATEQTSDGKARERGPRNTHTLRARSMRPDRPPRPAAIMPRPQDVLLAA
jgi:hypothetical protein